MSSLTPPFEDADANPLDLIEEIVSDHGWPLDRLSDQELATTVAGRWCDYRLCFSWQDQPSTLRFSCALDLTGPEDKRGELSVLLALVNERMWLGHFDLWSAEGALMFNHALLLGPSGVSAEQFDDLVEIGIAECERFYPAFGLVISGSKSPEQAVAAALLEVQGEA